MSYRNKQLYPPGGYDPPGRDALDPSLVQGHHHGGVKDKVEKFLDVFYRRKWVFVACLILLSAAVTAFVLLQRPDPVYRGSSFVMVDLSTRPNNAASAGRAADKDDFFARNDRTVGDELFILRTSTLLAQRVADRIIGEFAEQIDGEPDGRLTDDSGTLLEPDAMASRIRRMVDFSLERRSGTILRLSAMSEAPREAGIVSTLYAEEYARLTRESGRRSMAGTEAFFEEQAENWRQELLQGEHRIQAYLSEHTSARLDRSGTLLVSQLADLEARRDDARIELEMRRAGLRDLEQELQEISPRIAEQMVSDLDRRIRALETRIVELETQREQIRVRYPGSDIPAHAAAELQQIDARLADLKQESLTLTQQYIADQVLVDGGQGAAYLADRRRQATQERTAISTLDARIRVMETRLEQLNQDLRNVPRQSIELAQLERARMHAERMYEMVASRMLETRVAGDAHSGGYVRIIEKAGLSAVPLGDNAKRNMMLGLLLALVAAFGLTFGVELLDNKLYKPDDIKERGFHLLTVVPNLQPLIKDVHRSEQFVSHGNRKFATSLVTLLNPMSAVSESYRQLRTKIQFARADRVIQAILVTSPSMGEGKSLTAANLAVVMAQAGRRTLLLDTDLYRPRVQNLFGLTDHAGLVQVLLGETTVANTIEETGVDDLYALPAGKPVLQSAKLLTDRRCRSILAELREQFDCIVVDTPPLRAMSETMFLAAMCDATIMVARAGKTKEAELELGFELLEDVGAHILGTLFNGFDLAMAYGYKYRYGNYQTYSQHSRHGYYQDQKS